MRFLAFVLGIALLLSMGIGGAVHASERICEGAQQTQFEHSDGKSSDSDKETGAPHVHGCHGHHIATPGMAGTRAIVAASGERLSASREFRLPGTRASPELRPPQA